MLLIQDNSRSFCMLYYTYTSSLSPSHFLGGPLSLTSLFLFRFSWSSIAIIGAVVGGIVVLAIVVGVVS